jgi:hypothetical protein
MKPTTYRSMVLTKEINYSLRVTLETCFDFTDISNYHFSLLSQSGWHLRRC